VTTKERREGGGRGGQRKKKRERERESRRISRQIGLWFTGVMGITLTWIAGTPPLSACTCTTRTPRCAPRVCTPRNRARVPPYPTILCPALSPINPRRVHRGLIPVVATGNAITLHPPPPPHPPIPLLLLLLLLLLSTPCASRGNKSIT